MKPILKFVFLTDTHLMASSPRSRIDNYSQAVLSKLQWVIDYAVARGVDVILHGGDFFDGYDGAKSIEASTIRVLKRAGNIPIVSTIGSHDIHGYSLSTISRSSIGLLEAFEQVEFLRRGDVHEVNSVQIIGCPHSVDLDNDVDGYLIEDLPNADYRILLAHGNLVDHELPDGFEHTLLSSVRVNAEMVLSGHYHPGHGVYHRDDGVIFINPGSVARRRATPNNRVRVPAIAYVEVFIDAPPHIEVVSISVSAPGSEVFSDEEPVQEPSNNDVALLVEHLKSHTDRAGVLIDVEESIRSLPVEGDADIVKAARLRALELVQAAQ